MFKKLRTVIYHTDNLDAAKAWYEKITGVSPYFDQPFYVGFNINGCELGLDPDMNNITHGNGSVAYWSVSDIASAVDLILNQQGTIINEITDVGDGIKVAIVRDPWNNPVGLIQED